MYAAFFCLRLNLSVFSLMFFLLPRVSPRPLINTSSEIILVLVWLVMGSDCRLEWRCHLVYHFLFLLKHGGVFE